MLISCAVTRTMFEGLRRCSVLLSSRHSFQRSSSLNVAKHIALWVHAQRAYIFSCFPCFCGSGELRRIFVNVCGVRVGALNADWHGDQQAW